MRCNTPAFATAISICWVWSDADNGMKQQPTAALKLLQMFWNVFQKKSGFNCMLVSQKSSWDTSTWASPCSHQSLKAELYWTRPTALLSVDILLLDKISSLYPISFTMYDPVMCKCSSFKYPYAFLKIFFSKIVVLSVHTNNNWQENVINH